MFATRNFRPDAVLMCYSTEAINAVLPCLLWGILLFGSLFAFFVVTFLHAAGVDALGRGINVNVVRTKYFEVQNYRDKCQMQQN